MILKNVLRLISFGPMKGQCRSITNAMVTEKRNEMFESEKKAQLNLIRRVEKIKVHYKGLPEECTMMMNQGISTPYNCAMHLPEFIRLRSGLAMVDGQTWDMHRPLENECTLNFSHFLDENPADINMAYWRTCSFLLGYVLERAFKQEHYVQLCSFPPPKISSGSFIYDADLKFADWSPSNIDLNCLSRIAGKLHFEDNKIERLEVDVDLALKMFEDNKFKTAQIPFIAKKSITGTRVSLYRMKDHVDVSKGALICNTSLLGRFSVTGIHPIETQDYGTISRVQGVSTPSSLHIHHYAYDLLCKRAAPLNTSAAYPSSPKHTQQHKGDDSDDEEHHIIGLNK